MLEFDAIEAAIAAWLAAGTGLSSSRIVKKDAKIPQPAMPYVTYKVGPPVPVYAQDEERWSDVQAPPSGAEVRVDIAGQREITVKVQCFTKSLVGAADSEGHLTAKDYLSRARTAIALPSVRAAVIAAGLCFVDVLSFVDFSEPLGPVGQGRAALDLRFRAVDSASDATTYIQNVSGQVVNPPAGINPAGTWTPN